MVRAQAQHLTFRDVNRAMRDRLSAVIASRPDVIPDPHPEAIGTPPSLIGQFNSFNEYLNLTRPPRERIEEVRYYDYLQDEIADARRALDAYATMATTGNLAGGGSETYSVRMVNDESEYPEALVRRFKELEKLMSKQSYSLIRGMAKYGTYAPQIVTGRKRDRRFGVVDLKHLPPASLFRHAPRNRPVDPERFWYQKTPNQSQPVYLPQWMVPNFSIWSDVVSADETLLYGTSILKPFGAIGLKVASAVDSTVVARLTRAAARYKWIHDVTDIIQNKSGDVDTTKKVMGRLNQWANAIERQSVSEEMGKSAFGKMKPPEQDFHIPGAKNFTWDVELLSGDTNVGQVADIEMLFRLYFGALGVPPEYLGHERSQGGRSNLSQIDIQFARASRHIQMFGAAGFEHMVYADMVLGGYDPMQYPIEICPPKIGARDDLLQAQIRDFQSQVLERLASAGMNLSASPKWVLKTFLNMGEELESLDEGTLRTLFTRPQAGPPSNGEEGGSDEAAHNMDPEQLAKFRRDISAENSEMMDQVRRNVQMLAVINEPTNMDRYRMGHPEPTELERQIHAL